MSDYSLALYFWSSLAAAGAMAPVLAFAVRSTLSAIEVDLPCG